MAAPSNTLITYDAIGNREDLSDIIYDVSPTETPFLTAIGKGKATSTKHEWLTRSLTAASATNFITEGEDATTDASNANVRRFNYCGISDKVARISGTQEKVEKAGMKSVMARELVDMMKELKRDVEMAALENNAHVAGDSTTAREVGGAPAYIFTNISKDSGGTAAAGTGADGYTDGTARVLQESYVEAALALAWSNGGTPNKGFLNAFQKRKFATFSGSSSKQLDGATKKVINSVDVYVDPLGTEVTLVPCRQMPTDMIYFIDPEYVKFCPLRNFQSHDLAKTGDSERKQVIVEWTVEWCNEKAHAGVYDLTTS